MKKNIAETIRDLIVGTVEELGYTLWDVDYHKEGADAHLEVTIDSADGITIDDCERVHRAIEPIIDEADPIESFYYLDVSSPGIERILRTDDHIRACIGEECEARLFAPCEGSRTWQGILTSFEDGVITLTVGEKTVSFPRTAVSKLRTVFHFGDI